VLDLLTDEDAKLVDTLVQRLSAGTANIEPAA